MKNKFGHTVKMCCASCANKDLTRCAGSRYCEVKGDKVKPEDFCRCWRLSSSLKMVGMRQGQVKCREYLMYALMVREDEACRIEKQEEVFPRNIEEIRQEFEALYGDIYEIK